MNKIQELHQKVLNELPEAKICIEDNKGAVHPDKCSWWLDISLQDRRVIVEWRPDKDGLGLYYKDLDIPFCSPDEVYEKVDGIMTRIREILNA